MSKLKSSVDIAERQQTEQAQRRMDELFRALIENALDVITIIDAEGVIRYESPSVERVLGYKPAELIGVNIVELLHPEDVPKTIAVMKAAVPTGTPEIWQVRVRHKDGSWRIFESVAKEIPGIPSVTGIVVNSRDITKRKRAEEAQAAIYRISQAAVFTENLKELYHSIHGILGELIPVENFYIALYDPASDLLSFPYFVDQYDESPPPKKLGHGLTEYVLRTRRPLLASQEVFDQLVQQGEVELVGTNSIDWLGVSLKTQERVIGVMVAQSYTEGIRFTQKDTDLFEFVSTQVALAIERKRTEEQMQQNAARLTDISKLGIELAALHEESAVLNTLVTCAAVIMESTTCTVMMINTAANEAVLTAHTGLPKSTPSDLRVPLTLPVIRQMLETGEPIILSDIDLEAPAMRTVLVRPDIRAFFTYPMMRAGRVIGIITFSKLTPYAPSAAEVAACRLLAERAAVALENARLFEETTCSLKRIQALQAIDITIASSFDLHLTLNILLEQTRTQLGVDAVNVLVYNPYTQMLDYAAGNGFRTTALQSTHLRLGQGYAGMAGLERKTIHVADLRKQKTDFLRSPTFSVEEFDAYFGVPLITKGQIKGVLEVFHRSPLQPDQSWVEFLETLAGQAAIAIDSAQLFDGLQSANLNLAVAYDATIEGWARALEMRDRETEGHTQRVTEMAVHLARAMGIDKAEIVHIRRGALLHDIGKMGIPDAILCKPGPLNEVEWAAIRKHPTMGYNMLAGIEFLKGPAEIVLAHHERWDGRGYPRGLCGEAIPLGARIFAVVDAIDAITSNRPYRAAQPFEAALEELIKMRGTQFDPAGVDVAFGIAPAEWRRMKDQVEEERCEKQT